MDGYNATHRTSSFKATPMQFIVAHLSWRAFGLVSTKSEISVLGLLIAEGEGIWNCPAKDDPRHVGHHQGEIYNGSDYYNGRKKLAEGKHWDCNKQPSN
jgi:hypothetical protein